MLLLRDKGTSGSAECLTAQRFAVFSPCAECCHVCGCWYTLAACYCCYYCFGTTIVAAVANVTMPRLLLLLLLPFSNVSPWPVCVAMALLSWHSFIAASLLVLQPQWQRLSQNFWRPVWEADLQLTWQIWTGDGDELDWGAFVDKRCSCYDVLSDCCCCCCYCC